MSQSSSSCSSNNVEPNFQKLVSEREIVQAMLRLNRWDFDAFIRPYMSPGHITSLSEVRGCCDILAFDVKTTRVFSVELVRDSDDYLLMGNGVFDMIRQNIFVAGYEVAFSWLNGALNVYRTN
ncbi:hypothetical protein V6N13_058169 [Hibiscus sabdariffa]|uniref:Uncharacterized protein n=1 Tax=Hibiscus sabdariffa TaxID=183260 RepID=A0ABR2GIQ6_9ROSI